MSHLVTSKTVTGDHELGGKARALADLSGAGFPVPPWLVVTPGAFAASLTDSRRAALESAQDDVGFRAALEGLELALPVRRELEEALHGLGGESETFAVRSSALEEDSAQYSFAGQLESFLFIPAPDVSGKIVEVWKSTFTARVLAYRRNHNLGPSLSAPAVLIQRMVNAEVSGVAFSADPVTGRRGVAVGNGNPGEPAIPKALGKDLVRDGAGDDATLPVHVMGVGIAVPGDEGGAEAIE